MKLEGVSMCWLVLRWWHRRLRAMDRKFIWTALDWKADTMEQRDAAWGLFVSMPGAEHWHCRCANADGVDESGRAVQRG